MLKTYSPGDTFGQLLLLHNNKRSASIVCTKPGRLYELSREVYKNFKKMSVIKKKITYIEALKKVKIFENFQKDEYEKICDVLT